MSQPHQSTSVMNVDISNKNVAYSQATSHNFTYPAGLYMGVCAPWSRHYQPHQVDSLQKMSGEAVGSKSHAIMCLNQLPVQVIILSFYPHKRSRMKRLYCSNFSRNFLWQYRALLSSSLNLKACSTILAVGILSRFLTHNSLKCDFFLNYFIANILSFHVVICILSFTIHFNHLYCTHFSFL